MRVGEKSFEYQLTASKVVHVSIQFHYSIMTITQFHMQSHYSFINL